jgi:hypothetical protein
MQEYERWIARYRDARDPFDAAGGGDARFDDAGVYRAFLTADGVDSELLFAFPAADEEATQRRSRELLELSGEALAALQLPGRRHYRPAVLEVLHTQPGRPTVDMGWHGAPESAPTVSWRTFIERARTDIRRRLERAAAA